MLFNYKWERISEIDVERISRTCKLTTIERRILELRRKGISPDVVADEIGYSRPQMFRLSKALLEKILSEL